MTNREPWRVSTKNGLDSEYLNRPLSAAISRRLVYTRVTPNQISALQEIVWVISVHFRVPGACRSGS